MGITGNVATGRAAGVVLPPGQRQGRGTPKTLTNFVEMKTYAVEWTDDAGKTRIETMHQVGKTWYRAPNGENYAASLTQVAPDSWLVRLFEDRTGASTTPMSVPAEDAVDILPGDG